MLWQTLILITLVPRFRSDCCEYNRAAIEHPFLRMVYALIRYQTLTISQLALKGLLISPMWLLIFPVN